ncbi:MAG: hypothetical protein MJ143_06255 [Clostridia bacterium]|nr:hypothetical protein [Clostridia bacterium]
MTKKERKQLAAEVEEKLDELSYELTYEICDYHDSEEEMSVVQVDFDIDELDDCPDDWDEDVEDIMSDIVADWGGWYCWDGWAICICIPDND